MGGLVVLGDGGIRPTREGMSLSDYLIAEIRRIAEKPTVREVRERAYPRSAPSFLRTSSVTRVGTRPIRSARLARQSRLFT